MPNADSSWPRIVVHADMDAFYAAIEQLDNPDLRGKPILVGPNSHRGVVLTASYEARPFGVGSAMPMAHARRLCPQALIVPPRFGRYREVSARIMRVFEDFSPDVEALSLDEAFLDMTGAEAIFGPPRAIGVKLKAAVRDATGLAVSVGISGTKYVAKVASGHQKPDGLTVVEPHEAKAWLAPLPVSHLWGVGKKTEPRLHRLGLRTIGDVAAADPRWLGRELGRAGSHFFSLANAEDPRRVDRDRASKSIGSEVTLEKDIRDSPELRRHLRRSADEIGARLRRKQILALGVRVKLKTSDFQILTRQLLLTRPTDVADELYLVAVSLLPEFAHKGPFRLVGLAAYELVEQQEKPQLDLFNSGARNRKLETAVDALTKRFGAGVLRRADDIARKPKIGVNLDFLDDEEDTRDD
jgi:DNA polymerase-4